MYNIFETVWFGIYQAYEWTAKKWIIYLFKTIETLSVETVTKFMTFDSP